MLIQINHAEVNEHGEDRDEQNRRRTAAGRWFGFVRCARQRLCRFSAHFAGALVASFVSGAVAVTFPAAAFVGGGGGGGVSNKIPSECRLNRYAANCFASSLGKIS